MNMPESLRGENFPYRRSVYETVTKFAKSQRHCFPVDILMLGTDLIGGNWAIVATAVNGSDITYVHERRLLGLNEGFTLSEAIESFFSKPLCLAIIMEGGGRERWTREARNLGTVKEGEDGYFTVDRPGQKLYVYDFRIIRRSLIDAPAGI